MRSGGLETEIDQKELAFAVEGMKAMLKDCNLWEVKREDNMSPSTRQQELRT